MSDTMMVEASAKSDTATKTSRRAQNDLKWDSLKDDIYSSYIAGGRTLQQTMGTIQERHGFKASERKWKEKLDEWKFDKKIPATDMSIILAKAEKRTREEGKDTIFFHGETQISFERIEQFKRRKTTKMLEAVSPSAETPDNITYGTPDADKVDSLPTEIREKETTNTEADETYLLPDVYTSRQRNMELSVIDEEVPIPRTGCSTTASPTLFPNLKNTSVENAQTMLTASHLQDELPQVEEILAQSTLEDGLQSGVEELVSSRHSESSSRVDDESRLEKSLIPTITDAERALLIAVEMEKLGSSLKVIFEQLKLFPRYFSTNNRSRICDLLESLSSKYIKKNRLVEAKMASELVVMGRTMEFGKSSKETLRAVCQRASVYTRCKLYALAETSYWSVIEDCLHSGDNEHLHGCQLILGALLRRLERHSEALTLLLQALFGFSSSLDLVFNTSMVLDSILQSHAKMYPTSAGAHASACIVRLKEVIESSLEPSLTPSLRNQCWLNVISLGSAYSVMDDFGHAETCFAFAVPKLESSTLLASQTLKEHETNKAHACLEHGLHYQRQGNFTDTLRQITKVYVFMKAGDVRDDHLAAKIGKLFAKVHNEKLILSITREDHVGPRTKSLFAKLRSRYKNLPGRLEVQSVAIALRDAVAAEESYRLHCLRGQVDGHVGSGAILADEDRYDELNNHQGDLISLVTGSSGSYRYGVTYSTGSEPIVSNSVYMCP